MKDNKTIMLPESRLTKHSYVNNVKHYVVAIQILLKEVGGAERNGVER